jgi:long-subunit fatty acid transport protein
MSQKTCLPNLHSQLQWQSSQPRPGPQASSSTNSSSGLGRAYSGEGAIADDAGNASRNPALMMFDRPTFSAGAIFVDPVLIFQAHHHRCQPGFEKYRANSMGSKPALRRAN